MKKSKRIILSLLMVVLALGLLSLGTTLVNAEDKISKPGVYSGYSEAIYDGYQRFSQYVEVRDGTKLAMDYYLPTLNGEVVDARFPVIFTFTPYGRATYGPDGSMRLAVSSFMSLVYHGYVLAAADARGTYASYGIRKATNNQTEAWDGHDLVQWLAEQPWSTGDVGMTGCSYVGGTVHEAIRTMPPNLKAVFFSADFNAYDAKGQGGLLRGPSREPNYLGDLIAVPVDGDTDEDGDGYADMLYEAVMMHQYNPPQIPFVQSIPFRDSWSVDDESIYWEMASLSNYLEEVEMLGVPAYIHGGWYCFMRLDTILTYINWPNPKKVFIGSWPHCGYARDTTINWLPELHRFFDYWLKGIENGVMDEPPIYFATEKAPEDKLWQFTADWPIPHQKYVKYYLKVGPSGTAPSVNDGVLSRKRPRDKNAKDDYTSDYTITTSTDWYGGPRPTGAELDVKGLTYTTEPLEADTKIQGHSLVTLWVSSEAPDSGFFLTIEDVDEDGNAIYVGDGRLKASMRQTHEPPFDNLGLPWHRNYEEDAQELIPGEPTKLYFDLLPMSYVFKAGHRIRLVITNQVGGWFVNIPKYDPPPEVSVYRDFKHASYIKFPVIPDKAMVFTGDARIKLSKGNYYKGPAELYTFESAVYLNFDNQWINWTTLRHWESRFIEHYKCRGELGRLSVWVKDKKHDPSTALATGGGVYFKGQEK